MVWWRIPLYPFAIIYDLITRSRNHLYNIGSTPSFDFETNIISVGNLAMGGTGKTPMVEYLADHFINQDRRIAILSRGYARKTRGFRIVQSGDDARSVGDESIGYFNQFGSRSLIAVSENRALAIPQILWEQRDNDVILLDDAFQHRSVLADHSILLTTYSRPFSRDHVFPAGFLRESRKGARRADTIIMTGCPLDLSLSEQNQITRELRKFNDQAAIYFTARRYHDAKPFFEGPDKKDRVVAVAGIADPGAFYEEMNRKFDVAAVVPFEDHHMYTNKDITKITKIMKEHDAMMICTNKDAVKMRKFDALASYPCFSISYYHWFLGGERDFLKRLDFSLKSYQREY